MRRNELKALPFRPFDYFQSLNWSPYSRLIVKNDGSNWVLSSIADEMTVVCESLGIETVDSRYQYNTSNQSIFFTSKYEVLMRWKKYKHRIAFPYFHGHPSSNSQFNHMVSMIRSHHQEIDRIQVSCSQVEDFIRNTGIDEDKVYRIPISIDMNLFKFTTPQLRRAVRARLGIPLSAQVVGSFQKDGIGWGEGKEPKLIKGPDIFIDTIRTLKDRVPEIFVLLTGSSRGYVKEELTKLDVPYKHFLLEDYDQIGSYYNALDVYIVSSREEGGPRAILESMASGIPIISTKVGQAIDLVDSGKTGWLVDVEDFEGLAYWAEYVFNNQVNLDEVLYEGQQVAFSNCYDAQIPMWHDFMSGFVDFDR